MHSLNVRHNATRFGINLLAALTLLLNGCGVGEAAPTPASSYTITGTVSGLTGTVVLQNNAADNHSVSANGPFTFATRVASGNPYSVSVLTQPTTGQICSVGNGAGTVSTNVTNVAIACASQMGGTMQGIALNLAPAVSILVGTVAQGAADGAGTLATFRYPSGITSDGVSLYVVDRGNHKIRRIVIATGAVSTLAGTGVPGAADGAGAAATFYGPSSITTDGTSLYVADMNNHKIRRIVIATGVVSTLAGTGVPGAADGAGTVATFSAPSGITTDGASLYVADSGNHKIRRIVIATGVVSTLAGTGAPGRADGPGAKATFGAPSGITSDGISLYVAVHHTIRRIR